MAKRTYRKRSGYAKKRRFRRPYRKLAVRRIPRGPSYDGFVARKITTQVPFSMGAQPADDVGFRVYWGLGQTAPADGGSIALSSPQNFPEWLTFRALFRQYQIRGCKVSFRVPSYTGGGANATSVGFIASATETRDTQGSLQQPTQAILEQRDDYVKTFGNRPHKRYFGVSKWVRKQNQLVWKEINEDYCDPATTFRVHTRGYVADQNICQIEVTFYVIFRGTAVGPPI